MSFHVIMLLSFFYATLAGACGVAFVRLQQPIGYYAEKYDDPHWGSKKLLMLMEKQRNRGQDGAGIAVVKFDMPFGQEYMQQLRFPLENSVDTLFEHVMRDQKQPLSTDPSDWKSQFLYTGEAYLGHLRYGTYCGIQLKYCQPYVRHNEVACRHFALAGNFNMTNTSDLFQKVGDLGFSPVNESDTQVILDTISYYLDKEYERVMSEATDAGLSSRERTEFISQRIDLPLVFKHASRKWDGGYLFCGILGNGDAFLCRDPAGIRPGYYVINDEVIAAASERIALIDTFHLNENEILAVEPGHIIVIKKNGEITNTLFTTPLPEKSCVFERIYFSKASDGQIYEERKALGRELAPQIFDAIGGDLAHTIFTYVPNSSLAAFQGLTDTIGTHASQIALQQIEKDLSKGIVNKKEIQKLASLHVRTEYIITKNQRIRTFISADQNRKNLIAQLYEVTQGVVTPEDTWVVIDDSIVRGATLRDCLIQKLIELNPKKIIIVSSAPPVLYPDCYGIDISQLGKFIAFQAAVSLHKERGTLDLFDGIQAWCSMQKNASSIEIQNQVKQIYEPFTLGELSNKIAELVTPQNTDWKGTVQIVYQSLEGLRRAIPDFKGDWYFSGDYPTPGGFQVLNTSFLNWHKGDSGRSY
jgi:amidophosphoribosyltransferase